MVDFTDFKTKAQQDTEKKALLQDAQAAIANLDNIINTIDAATTTQMKTAIKTEAQILKGTIKRLLKIL